MEMSCQSTAQKMAGKQGRNKSFLDLSRVMVYGSGT